MISDNSLLNSSVENLTKECLGYAEDVYEHVLVNLHSYSMNFFIAKNSFLRVKKNLPLLKVVKIPNR
jgi:hypothetical protein